MLIFALLFVDFTKKLSLKHLSSHLFNETIFWNRGNLFQVIVLQFIDLLQKSEL